MLIGGASGRLHGDATLEDVRGSFFGGAFQTVATLLMGVLMAVCLHIGLVQLSGILVPFTISGFIVATVEPTVEVVFGFITGRVAPYRWCCCCCSRRWRRRWVSSRAAKSEKSSPEGSSATSGQEDLDCFGFHPPPGSDAEAGEMLLEEPRQRAWKPLEDIGDIAGRVLAVSLALGAMLFVIFAFVTLLVRGAMHMRESLDAYRVGVQKIAKEVDAMTAAVSKTLKLGASVDQRAKEINSFALKKMQQIVEALVNYIVAGVSVGITSLMIILLYVMFWLMKPLPFAGQVSDLVRNYIWKKTFVSFLYGLWVALLFFALGNDLAIFFGMVSFFLNFVPEVGAFISICLPIPVILLDGRLESPLRTACIAVVGQSVLKFLFNNVLEVKLIMEDKEMNIHPVWVLVGLNYFNFVWGTAGMLISVPLLAIVKSTVLSVLESEQETMILTKSWAESVLNCLEGRTGKGSPSIRRRRGNLSPGKKPESTSAEVPSPEKLSAVPDVSTAESAVGARS